MDDQVTFLVSKSVPVCVGTPGRVLSIYQEHPSILNQVKHIIIDCIRDSKLRTVFEIPEIQKPLFDLVTITYIESISIGSTKISFAN